MGGIFVGKFTKGLNFSLNIGLVWCIIKISPQAFKSRWAAFKTGR